MLWGGILLSIAIILLGLGAKALSPAAVPQAPTPIPDLPGLVAAWTPAGLLSLGVLAMILTPIARVLLTIPVFASERDRTYVLVTGIVFLNLMVGVALGLLGVGG